METIREQQEQFEERHLSPYAAKSGQSQGRVVPIPSCPIRTQFQRDRDRILHSKSFRRLKGKTQVFLAPKGDHYRTRLTHTLEVSQIARTIARALRLNEDLTEAITLGHDLGHTPFGHAGEEVLNEYHPEGFRHFEQSLRVVEKLENDGAGLNLTYETLDGIGGHSKGTGLIVHGQRLPQTLEGSIVRFADVIAYLNHDIEDALRADVIREEELPRELLEFLGSRRSERIGRMVRDVIENSLNRPDVSMSSAVLAATQRLKDSMYTYVYTMPSIFDEVVKAKDVLRRLMEYFLRYPDLLPPVYRNLSESEGVHQAVCDYVAGMTDQFALETFRALFLPKEWGYS